MSMMMLYGRPIIDIMAEGDLDTMRAYALVSAKMLENSDDLEDEAAEEWKAAHEELIRAISSKESILLESEDVVAIRDGIVVIDSISLARALKTSMSDDLEETTVRVTVTVK